LLSPKQQEMQRFTTQWVREGGARGGRVTGLSEGHACIHDWSIGHRLTAAIMDLFRSVLMAA